MKIPDNYNNLTAAQRRKLREEYIKLQEGTCYYCKDLLSGPPAKRIAKLPVNKALFPKSFFKYPVHLHHNHETGETKGAVHNYCNAVLWYYHGE